MKKVAFIGSTNIDLITYSDRKAKEGETLEAQTFKIEHGGKGSNQAVAAAKCGSNVIIVSKVGDDSFANMCLDNYKKQGIDTTFVQKVENTNTGVASIFVNNKTSQNSILIIKGANEYVRPNDIDKAYDVLKNVDMIVLQLEIPLQTVYYAIDFAVSHGVKVLLNPAPAVPNLSLEYVCKCDFLIPNETELEILTGMHCNTIDEIKVAANYLFNHGLKNLIVTLGSRGALWISKENELLFKPRNVNAIDTSGAGDAFIGCFSHFYTQTGNIEQSIEKSVIFSGISVMYEGTQSSYPELGLFEKYIKNTERS